jgi:CrcB protein
MKNSFTIITVLLVSLGGALGSLLRFLCTSVVQRSAGSIFPFGTLSVNLIGSFAIGFLWYSAERLIFPSEMRSFVFVGLLGGFTTFSSFSIENLNLLRDGHLKLAAYNMLVSNLFALALVLAGFFAAKYVFK